MMLTTLYLVVSVAAALLVHELGHLMIAAKYGVASSEVALGLGPKLCGIRIRNVSFNLRLLPLGSFVRLDGATLSQKALSHRLQVHLGGVLVNLLVGAITYGTIFGQINLLVGFANLLPLYQHDGWKCGVALMRALLRRRSQPVELAFTFSGVFVTLVIIDYALRLLR